MALKMTTKTIIHPESHGQFLERIERERLAAVEQNIKAQISDEVDAALSRGRKRKAKLAIISDAFRFTDWSDEQITDEATDLLDRLDAIENNITTRVLEGTAPRHDG